jgi:dTDP-4-amino-4,6-dideoxygalactose transaminase
MKNSESRDIPFALPDISDDEINEVVNCLRSGWLTTGPLTKKFEEQFAEYLGVRHALAVNSGTAGLHLALEASGIKQGDKVATSVYTFTATAEVIRYLQADPIFVDIDPKTLNIDPDQLLDKIDASTKAIIPVHIAGQACDMQAITQIAADHDLSIIEDAAHAIPAEYNHNAIGTIGDATVFSFYVTKTIATGEGGMVVTDSDQMAERIRVMRLHGINRDIWDRYRSSKPNWYYEVIEPGYKYNMPDIMAAIGIHQLRKAERFRQRREAIARRYNEAFQHLPITLPRASESSNVHAWHLFIIQLDNDQAKVSRDEFIEKMATLGIGTSVHFIPLHYHPYWKNRYNLFSDEYPVATKCYRSVVSLPIYSKMTDEEVERVVLAVRSILE